MATRWEVLSEASWSWQGRVYPPLTWVEIEELDDTRLVKQGVPDLRVRQSDRWADPNRYSIDALTQQVIKLPIPVTQIPAGNPPIEKTLAPLSAPVVPPEPPASVEVPVESTAVVPPFAESTTEESKETLPDMTFDDEPADLESRIRVAVPKLATEVLAGALAIVEQKPTDLVEALQSVKGIGKSTAVKIAEAVTNG